MGKGAFLIGHFTPLRPRVYRLQVRLTVLEVVLFSSTVQLPSCHGISSRFFRIPNVVQVSRFPRKSSKHFRRWVWFVVSVVQRKSTGVRFQTLKEFLILRFTNYWECTESPLTRKYLTITFCGVPYTKCGRCLKRPGYTQRAEACSWLVWS